jgi:UDP-GlcNAc3NAcA epimerase
MVIATVIGARPQFIKAAVLSRELAAREKVREIIIHTGQHYDTNMSEVFFKQMQIPEPSYSLHISSSHHGAMTGRMIESIEEVLVSERPDILLVYGDTNSTLAGAIAAKKLHIPVAHVEAGLRSLNMKMPEEINRILTDRMSDLLFCPGTKAIENLKREAFDSFDCKMYNVGDIMKDAALFYKTYENKPSFHVPRDFILATIHRAENTDNAMNLACIMDSLTHIAKDIPVVLPLHPRTKKCLADLNLKGISKILISDPIGYLEMVYLLNRCKMVITDSGGLQKESYFFGKPCITMREETEWTELVEAGFNIVVGTNRKRLTEAINTFSNSPIPFSKDIYGDGRTAERIADILMQI